MASIVEIIQEFYTFLYVQASALIGETYFQLFSFTIGLFLYSVFVWYFYKSLSKRDLFKINLSKYSLPETKHKTLGKLGSVLKYILKYGIIFPIYILVWFAVLSMFLLILTEEATVNQILIISIVFVSTVRISSYFKEDLSNDLAKLIPFVLLGVSLTDINFFVIETTVARLSEISTLWSDILQFLVFSVLLEWLLRLFYVLKVLVSKRSVEDLKESD